MADVRRLDVQLTPIDKSRLGKVPQASEMGRVISESTVIYHDDRPIAAYLLLPENMVTHMRKVVQTTKYQESARVGGIPTKSSVFGAMPRVPMRNDYCRYAANTRTEPQHLNAITRFNEYLCGVYAQYFPEKYALAMQEVEENVRSDWRWMPGPFLTANVNVNHAIPYHRDSGNMKSALSNVFILKKNIIGGELVCPEFGVTLAQQDRALCIFDGQSVIHGVRPIRRAIGESEYYRASIVYYTLAGLKKCDCQAGELSRIQDVKTKLSAVSREDQIAKVITINKRLLKNAGYIKD